MQQAKEGAGKGGKSKISDSRNDSRGNTWKHLFGFFIDEKMPTDVKEQNRYHSISVLTSKQPDNGSGEQKCIIWKA